MRRASRRRGDAVRLQASDQLSCRLHSMLTAAFWSERSCRAKRRTSRPCSIIDHSASSPQARCALGAPRDALICRLSTRHKLHYEIADPSWILDMWIVTKVSPPGHACGRVESDERVENG
jgi:hypothetical protein